MSNKNDKKDKKDKNDKNDKKDYIIGIDYGTTNSCSAIYMEDKIIIIPDGSSGKGTIPSVVCYMENNEVLVGKLAEGKQIEYSQSTIFQSKRYIGHQFNDKEVQNDIKNKRMYVKLTEDKSTGKAMYVLKIENEKDKTKFPEDVASEIIKYIKENAEKYLESVLGDSMILTKAVITVPTHYKPERIEAVREAFKKAKLNVIKVIKEPEAIGIAYGYFHKKNKPPATILIVDIGGGTFGLSILKIQGDKFEFIDSEGSGHLGGDDFEKALRDYIVQQIEKANKFDLDFKTEKKYKDIKWVRVLLKIKAETSKVLTQLSTQKNLKLEIKQLDGKNDFSINISQDKYKELTQPLLDKCEKKLNALFERVNKNKIDEILLVGGTTRASNIQKILEKLFPGKPIFQNLNADEAVAQGAAIIASDEKKYK